MLSGRIRSILGVAVAGLLISSGAVKADIKSTIQGAASGTTVQCTGTYSIAGPIAIPAGVTVKGPATFNFTGSGNGFTMQGANSTIQSITAQTAGGVGIYIYNGSGCHITSCNAYSNKNTGIQIQGSSAKNNVVSGCISKLNADVATLGQNADGFACKFASSTGNSFSNCDSHQNSDDGWDLWQAGAPVTISNCKAYSNGSLADGNGNGFKMGSTGDKNAHVMTSDVAYSNAGTSGSGFTQNGNTGATHLTTCHSYSNKNKDVLNNCVLTNCTMQQ